MTEVVFTIYPRSLSPKFARSPISHIGERVIGERENLGESDRGEIVKTTSVMFGIYVPGIKLVTSFWSRNHPN